MIDFKKKLNASITVEAAIGFTLTIFIFFLMLGPLLIIKTSSDILIRLNKASKLRCNYEMIKDDLKGTSIANQVEAYISDNKFLSENVKNIENVANVVAMIEDFNNEYDESKREYRNINHFYNMNSDIYLEDTNEVLYDFAFWFSLPYNLLHIRDIRKRLVNNRRAFVGAVGDRFSHFEESGEFVYVANNHVNSNVYHLFLDCTYLEKNTESVEYSNMSIKRNLSNHRYTKCDYCFRGIALNDSTICYITQYGDKYHYKSNCPLMTAYVTKILKDKVDEYNMVLCSRCSKREIK